MRIEVAVSLQHDALGSKPQ